MEPALVTLGHSVAVRLAAASRLKDSQPVPASPSQSKPVLPQTDPDGRRIRSCQAARSIRLPRCPPLLARKDTYESIHIPLHDRSCLITHILSLQDVSAVFPSLHFLGSALPPPPALLIFIHSPRARPSAPSTFITTTASYLSIHTPRSHTREAHTGLPSGEVVIAASHHITRVNNPYRPPRLLLPLSGARQHPAPTPARPATGARTPRPDSTGTQSSGVSRHHVLSSG